MLQGSFENVDAGDAFLCYICIHKNVSWGCIKMTKEAKKTCINVKHRFDGTRKIDAVMMDALLKFQLTLKSTRNTPLTKPQSNGILS